MGLVFRGLAGVVLLAVLLVFSGCGGSGQTTVTVSKTKTETLTRTAASEPVVYVPQVDGTPLYKPDFIGTSVDGGGIYEIKRWRSYGGNVATADARLSVNDCNPSCAEGHHRNVTMELRLSQRVPCRGVVAYGDMSIYNSSDPDFEGSYVTLSDFCKAAV